MSWLLYNVWQGQRIAVSALCCAAAAAAGGACGWDRSPVENSFAIASTLFFKVLASGWCIRFSPDDECARLLDFLYFFRFLLSRIQRLNLLRSEALAWDLTVLLVSAGFAQILSFTLVPSSIFMLLWEMRGLGLSMKMPCV